MVLVKKWPFFHVFSLGNIGQENVFCDILERKNAFLAYNKKKIKKSKNWDFSIVLVKKWPFFHVFFYGNISQENVFCDILERKNAFLAYNKKKIKKSKNWDFSIVLVKKWPFFHVFFYGNISQENVFCDILERKNTFLAYKNKKFKKSKNWNFSKAVNPWF